MFCCKCMLASRQLKIRLCPYFCWEKKLITYRAPNDPAWMARKPVEQSAIRSCPLQLVLIFRCRCFAWKRCQPLKTDLKTNFGRVWIRFGYWFVCFLMYWIRVQQKAWCAAGHEFFIQPTDFDIGFLDYVEDTSKTVAWSFIGIYNADQNRSICIIHYEKIYIYIYFSWKPARPRPHHLHRACKLVIPFLNEGS